MRRVANSFLLPIAIDEGRDTTPIYRQLYSWVREAILAGKLRPGQRVPSTRALAVQLKISRIPVMSAYEQLLAEGYLETFTGMGTCVARQIPEKSLHAPANHPAGLGETRRRARKVARRVSRRGTAILRMPVESGLQSLGAFRVTLPAVEHFPMKVWSKLVARHARTQSRKAMAYGDSMGVLALREAIAEYLGASRAVRCDVSQILITTGSQQALQLCAQVLLDESEYVCMEEPGYPGARNSFVAAGTKIAPIAVDEDGIRVARLMQQSSAVRAVYITPSHQYPTGVTMSAARRLALLRWAAKTGAGLLKMTTTASTDSTAGRSRRCRESIWMRG